jgi:DNA repair protein RecO (recombination protein O)
MAIINTPAIVLRRVNHGETSLIVNFYTREYGKIAAIAKGARRQKSQFAGLLDLMNYLNVVLYTKETREVQTLSSAEYAVPFLKIQQDIEKTYLGMTMLETLRQAIIGEEPHPEVFDLLVQSLEVLNNKSAAGIETLWWFHLHLVSLLGFQPQIQDCYQCGKALQNGFFSADTGQIHCGDCVIHQPGMIKLSNIEIRMFNYLLNTPLIDVDSLAIQKTLDETKKSGSQQRINKLIVTDTLVKYLRYHVEGIGTLQSLKFFTTFD